MKRRTQKALKVTADHAANALRVLIFEGKIAAKDVTNALRRREALIAGLRRRLATLEAGTVRKIGSAAKKAKQRVRRKRKLSAATQAKFRAQGRYMAAVGRLPKAARAKVKAIREKSGVRAAVAAAKRMAN